MPIDYTTADYEFNGESTGFAASLEAAFELQQENVETLDEDVADGNAALHGHGRETGNVLGVGIGLSARLTNGYYWASGRRYQNDELAGYLVIALPASQTRYLYQDADGAVSQYAVLQSPRPTGTWYVGSATTDSGSCTSVDQTGCDEIAALTDVQDAIGWPYTDSDDIETRLQSLEAGGGGGGGGYEYWGLMDESATSATRIRQAATSIAEAEVEAHEAAYHADDPVDTSDLEINERWDIDAVNQARHLLRYTEAVDPDGPEMLVDAVTVLDGIYGDGSGHDEFDFIDDTNTTWV